MIELSRHIESLLLDNDCVIVPELGGFIAHYQPAYYEEAEEMFLPPTRTVGFNPQLTMNDGLLAQSFMQAYHTDYSDAMHRISQKVDALKETLYSGETVELHGVGSLHYNIYDEYEFHSDESGLLSPSLYGLDAFSMPLLSNELPMEDGQTNERTIVQPLESQREIRLNPVRWIGNVAAVAVAVILFFVLSIPVENTYIDKGSYASLGTDCLFDAIRSQSVATTLSVSAGEPQVRQAKDLKPKAVREEKVAPVSKEIHVVKPIEETKTVPVVKPVEEVKKKSVAKAEPAPKKKEVVVSVQPKKVTVAAQAPSVKKETTKKAKYHIIVSSLATSDDAQRMLKEYNQKGYHEASVIQGNGRFRIALCSFADKNEAYRKLNVLKQEEAFKSAWMLSSK